MSVKHQFLRQSQDLKLKYIPVKNTLMIDGPQGTFCYLLRVNLCYRGKEKKFWFNSRRTVSKAYLNLSQVLLNQACIGACLGYRCQLNLVGIGYSASLETSKTKVFLVLKLGFSHSVRVLVPNYISVSCPKPRQILLKGINLQKVNNFAALIRDFKFPNSYKEKGIYYKAEKLKLKQGKKT